LEIQQRSDYAAIGKQSKHRARKTSGGGLVDAKKILRPMEGFRGVPKKENASLL
jgi:hypothetical protein